MNKRNNSDFFFSFSLEIPPDKCCKQPVSYLEKKTNLDKISKFIEDILSV